MSRASTLSATLSASLSAALFGLAGAACVAPPAADAPVSPASPGAEARRLVGAGAVLLDVRTPEEFADGHVDGARNIPVQGLAGRLAEVGDKGTPVVVYCRSGGRSATAARMLKGAGYTTVFDLGPMSAWSK
jgi:rhodanese-related sulfurtransferase